VVGFREGGKDRGPAMNRHLSRRRVLALSAGAVTGHSLLRGLDGAARAADEIETHGI
jgi:hypothetical protein